MTVAGHTDQGRGLMAGSGFSELHHAHGSPGERNFVNSRAAYNRVSMTADYNSLPNTTPPPVTASKEGAVADTLAPSVSSALPPETPTNPPPGAAVPVEPPTPSDSVLPSPTEPPQAAQSPPITLAAEKSATRKVEQPPAPTPEAQPSAPPDAPVAVNGIPAAVLALTDEELRVAAAYYLKKNQSAISRKGVEARQAQMNKRLDAIVTYIQSHSPAQIPSMSRQLNLSPGLTSHYLQILVKQGRIRATGHASTRRYST